MIGIHRFLTLLRPLSHLVSLGIVQKKCDILIERRRMLFER
jgi:hypothetical protein